MEAILLVTVVTLGLIVWKLMEIKDHHEQLDAHIKNIYGQLEGVAKLLAELQPKGPIEIPVRLDKELVEELLATETTEVNGLNITTPKRDDKFKEHYKNQTYTTYNAEVKPRPASDPRRWGNLTENEKQTLEKLYGKPKTELTAEEIEVKKQRILKEFSEKLEFKQKQRELLKAMMEADERDGLYEYEGRGLDGLPDKTKEDIREYINKQTKQKQGKK